MLYPTAYRKIGYFKSYDILIPKEPYNTTMEVKYDARARNTSNFAFEYKYDGATSGISTTESTFFVTVDEDKFYLFRTINLKDYIKTNWNYLRRVDGGDGNKSRLILVGKTDIVNQMFCYPFSRRDLDYITLKYLIDNS